MSTAAATAPPKIRKSKIRKNILGLAFLGGPLGGMAFWGALGPFGAPGGGPEGGGLKWRQDLVAVGWGRPWWQKRTPT